MLTRGQKVLIWASVVLLGVAQRVFLDALKNDALLRKAKRLDDMEKT